MGAIDEGKDVSWGVGDAFPGCGPRPLAHVF